MTTPPDFGSHADGSGTDKKKLVVAGGLAAALVLGAGGYWFTKSGTEAEEVAFPVKRTPKVAPKVAVKPAVKKAVKPVAKVPAVSTVKLGRDPFLALYTVPVVSAATVSTTTTPTTTDGTGTGLPGTSTGSVAYALTLKSITPPKGDVVAYYTFAYAKATRQVVAGQRFGTYGELIVLGYTTTKAGAVDGAVIQVGDDEPLEIALGEKVTVK